MHFMCHESSFSFIQKHPGTHYILILVFVPQQNEVNTYKTYKTNHMCRKGDETPVRYFYKANLIS